MMVDIGKPLFKELEYCVRCCMPETEEGTIHDELGICRACQSSEQKMHIDWTVREQQLRNILQKAKDKAGNNYDCVLPVSGGKDSTFQAHVLVKIYKMKPLAVTFSHNWYSETGWYNLINLIETFKLDHIMFTPNRDLVNRLAKRSLSTIGDTCWHCHSGCGAFPLQVAVKFNIPLMVYGESVAESQGRASYHEPLKYNKDYFTKVSAKMTPDQMVCDDISQKDLHCFQLPSQMECDQAGILGLHLGNYIFWDDERQTEFVRDEYGWKETEIENSIKHYKSAECIMPGMHDFTCYLKRGFGRATFQSTIDVRNGLLTREEAFKLIEDTDTIRPEALDYFLQITGMTEEEFMHVMETHRMSKLKGVKIPIKPRNRPNKEKILPFPLQLINKLKPKKRLPYITKRKVSLLRRSDQGLAGQLFFEYSIKKILRGYQKGLFSPVDIAKACISRIERLNPRYHSFEQFNPELLLAQARQIEKRLSKGVNLRALEGIPVGIKDIFNTYEYPTQMGSPIWKDFTPGNDARIVFNIKRAGGMVAGKTITAEFAVHTLGKTINPHDASRTPGTSSSGSAVAVALGMTPVAIGTQTAGSIIRPASFCGVYGVKPSFGLLPRTGSLKTTDSLDTIGFFATHFEDLAVVLDTLRVHGANYPISNSLLNDEKRQKKDKNRPFKIALLKPHIWHSAAGYAKESFLKWCKLISSNREIEIEEANLPDIMAHSHEVHSSIYNRTLAYYFREEARKKELVSAIMYDLIEQGNRVTKQQYHRALKAQEDAIYAMDEFMKNFDAAICLSTAGVAPLREEQEASDSALMWTLTHLPVIGVPAFVSAEGLPFGAQIIARKYNDLLLFELAQFLNSRNYIPDGPNPVLNLPNG